MIGEQITIFGSLGLERAMEGLIEMCVQGRSGQSRTRGHAWVSSTTKIDSTTPPSLVIHCHDARILMQGLSSFDWHTQVLRKSPNDPRLELPTFGENNKTPSDPPRLLGGAKYAFPRWQLIAAIRLALVESREELNAFEKKVPFLSRQYMWW